MRGRLVDALLQGLIGYLSLERRIGDVWVRRLYDFLQILSKVLGSKTCSESPIFPTEAQLETVFHGYLYELACGASNMFGAQAEYTRAC